MDAVTRTRFVAAFAAALLCATSCTGTGGSHTSGSRPGAWQDDFGLDSRRLATTGRGAFFVLEPGYQLVLVGGEDRLIITVLDETRVVDGVETRVVEEREEEDGELKEVSRNFCAIDPANGDVFYFGEEVDIYADGEVVKHEGAWLAGEQGAKPGLLMPGAPRVGQRYYQELAQGKALDRAEVVELAARRTTPAGTFEGCLRTCESTALDADEREFKTFAPGIGLIQEEELLLVRHGSLGAR